MVTSYEIRSITMESPEVGKPPPPAEVPFASERNTVATMSTLTLPTTRRQSTMPKSRRPNWSIEICSPPSRPTLSATRSARIHLVSCFSNREQVHRRSGAASAWTSSNHRTDERPKRFDRSELGVGRNVQPEVAAHAGPTTALLGPKISVKSFAIPKMMSRIVPIAMKKIMMSRRKTSSSSKYLPDTVDEFFDGTALNPAPIAQQRLI